MSSEELSLSPFIEVSEAQALLPVGASHTSPIKVFASKTLRDAFDASCLKQAVNSRLAPGVSELILNPDAHSGFGAPVGSVLVSPTHIYPGPVGVDIKCSMSLLQLDLPESELKDRRVRKALIEAICKRTPTGPGKGQRSVKLSRHVTPELGLSLLTRGADPEVCSALGIPSQWVTRLEDPYHLGHDSTQAALALRLEYLLESGMLNRFEEQIQQLGSYGGGNHFGECSIVEDVGLPSSQQTQRVFGLIPGHAAFLSHCGSRGLGHQLASQQFKTLQEKFDREGIPFPGGDKELVHAELGTEEANNYLDDMALAANFATLNHLLINALVLEAFQEVLPGTSGNLVYFISHNIARKEVMDQRTYWVHRKGATRAFPKGHQELKGTPFDNTGHPILLPGNPIAGSLVMVAEAGAKESFYSVNHGAGRAMGRRAASRTLSQSTVDASLDQHDILTNCARYPLDEAPDAYKNFAEVIRSVEQAGLARRVASLRTRFVIKDGDKSLNGAA